MRIESSSNNKHRQFWMNRPEKNGNPRKSSRKKGIISAAAPEAPWPSWAVVPPKRWGSMSQELVTFQESTGKLIWVVVSNIFIFNPIWGRFPFWLIIFFGWVVQPPPRKKGLFLTGSRFVWWDWCAFLLSSLDISCPIINDELQRVATRWGWLSTNQTCVNSLHTNLLPKTISKEVYRCWALLPYMFSLMGLNLWELCSWANLHSNQPTL